MSKKIILFGINAVLGLILAKLGIYILAEEGYGESVRVFLFVELSSALLGMGLPYLVEKNASNYFFAFWRYHVAIVLMACVYSLYFLQFFFEEYSDFVFQVLIVFCVYFGVLARCVTRYFIGKMMPNSSILTQIFETKLPIALGMIAFSFINSVEVMLVAFLMGKVGVLVFYKVFFDGSSEKIESQLITPSFWFYDLTLLFVANSVIIYEFYFGKSEEYAALWINFIVANAIATIIINASRVSVLSDFWTGFGKYRHRNIEVTLLVFSLFGAFLFGDKIVDLVFGVKGGEWVMLGTLLSWILYGIIGPKFELLLTQFPSSVLKVTLTIIFLMIVFYFLVYFKVLNIWILFFMPILLQMVSLYVLRYNYKRR